MKVTDKMQRYFLNDMMDKKQIVFTGEHYHHIVRVMRMKVGERVYVVLPDVLTCIVELVAITPDEVLTQWIEDVDMQMELPVHITIALGLPKGDKLDWIVQKTTELGVCAIQPFESERSVVKWEVKKKEKKQLRLQKIAQEAAEQSHRTCIPKIKNILTFKQLLTHLAQYTYVLVAYEESAKTKEMTQFKSILSKLKPNDTLLMIFGSEGGFSEQEIQQLVSHQAILCGLGPRIMRAETAPIYALAACSYQLELH